ncbi:MAG TPA: hypothetical protein VGO67_14270 [Verrucomicrobiae bacterium]|jgi:hypothetical protein
MTKQDFISRQKALKQNSSKPMKVWLVLFFAIILGIVPVSAYTKRHGAPEWVNNTIFVIWLILFIGNYVFIILFAKRQQRRFGYRCPTCNTRLSGSLAQIAVASSNCGVCGKSAFIDDASA